MILSHSHPSNDCIVRQESLFCGEINCQFTLWMLEWAFILLWYFTIKSLRLPNMMDSTPCNNIQLRIIIGAENQYTFLNVLPTILRRSSTCKDQFRIYDYHAFNHNKCYRNYNCASKQTIANMDTKHTR